MSSQPDGTISQVLSGPVSLPVTHPSEVGGEWAPACLLRWHSRMGQEGEGASSPHLLPIECFLSPEPTGQRPGFPNQEHLGEEAAEQG